MATPGLRLVDTDNTVSKTSAYPAQRLAGLKPVKPGQVLNPTGRPKGSRNKLGEAFLADLFASWQEYGPQTLRTVAREHPVEYIKIIVSILPKDAGMADAESPYLSTLTDEQIEESTRWLQDFLAEQGSSKDAPLD